MSAANRGRFRTDNEIAECKKTVNGTTKRNKKEELVTAKCGGDRGKPLNPLSSLELRSWKNDCDLDISIGVASISHRRGKTKMKNGEDRASALNWEEI